MARGVSYASELAILWYSWRVLKVTVTAASVIIFVLIVACGSNSATDAGVDAAADVVDDALVKSDAAHCVFGKSHFGDGCTFAP